jgi:hypothetical protein
MGRRPISGSEAMRQTTLRLPTSLYEKLAAAGGENGIGEEVRRRLEMPVSSNPATIRLHKIIEAVDAAVELDGRWDEDPFLFEVFMTALTTALDRIEKPAGDPKKRHDGSSYIILNPEHDDAKREGEKLASRALHNVKEL